MQNDFLLSVVIANYNYGRYLEDAIRSVLDQSCKDVELIVCDAGSTDNSVEIIKKYAGGLPPGVERNDPSILHLHLTPTHLSYWISESDKGQSDAFNKGFSHAHGKYLTWLNADDILMPGTIAALERAAAKHPDCQWFTGNYLQFRQDNKQIIFAPWGPHSLPRALQSFDSPLMIFGPSTFWSREAYQKIGLIDVNLHYSMDTDYWIRMKKAGYEQRRLNHCCWAFRMHADSKTAQYDGHAVDEARKKKWFEELARIHKHHGYHPSRWKTFLLRMWRICDGSALVAIYRKFFVVGSIYER